VAGNSTWDNIKKLAMASFAMKATERDPDFVGTFCKVGGITRSRTAITMIAIVITISL
jgi:hypothetical protein